MKNLLEKDEVFCWLRKKNAQVYEAVIIYEREDERRSQKWRIEGTVSDFKVHHLKSKTRTSSWISGFIQQKKHTEKIVLCTEIYRILHKTFRAEVRRKKNRIPCCFCHRMFVYSLQLSHSLLFCTSIKFLWSRTFKIGTWQVFINFSIAVQHFQCFSGVSFPFAGPRGEFVVWWNNFYWVK